MVKNETGALYIYLHPHFWSASANPTIMSQQQFNEAVTRELTSQNNRIGALTDFVGILSQEIEQLRQLSPMHNWAHRHDHHWNPLRVGYGNSQHDIIIVG